MSSSQSETNSKIALEIANYIITNDFGHDTRIYFNNMCYELHNNEIQVISNIKASDYFEYANDELISMSFEGPMYKVMNGYSHSAIYQGIDKILGQYGCYFELGNAWNGAAYKI